MTVNRLQRRGPNARAPAKLPALQAIRVEDPQVQRALEALREWVEVRLGSRGDPNEKAVTAREFEQRLKPLTDAIAQLGSFNGEAGSLRATVLEALPTQVRLGAIEQLKDGTAYLGTSLGWKKFTLTDPP